MASSWIFLIGFSSFAGIFFNLHLSILWFHFSNIFLKIIMIIIKFNFFLFVCKFLVCFILDKARNLICNNFQF